MNIPHREFSESALYAFKRAKEERKVIIEIPAAGGIDLYFFAGDVKKAVMRYNLFSGGGCLPPMWGLGMWYRVYGGSDENHVKKLAKGFREDKMPVDVIGIEPGWHSHSYSCTYEWGYLFPNHQEMVDTLNQDGYHVNLWEHIFIYPAAPFYEKLLDYSGDYEVWNGLVPDFATEEAGNIFAGWHEEQFIQNGIAGFKLDECDNSDFNPSNWSFPDSTKFPSGMDGEQMHNAVGMLWAPEVRDCASGEDLLRRVETIVFSPQALLNCWRIPNPPWEQVCIEKNLQNEAMEERAFYMDACRKLFELRMSLLPYLYSAFVEYHELGIPPVRAMAIEDPEDYEARGIDDQYFFGRDLLVCPLTLEDGDSREVYLPAGLWYGFFDGQPYEGGRRFSVQAKEEEIPVFVRDGAIVPMAKPVLCVREDTVFEMTIRSYGRKEGAYTLYEDDFTSFQYENEGMREVEIWRGGDGKIEIAGGENSLRYRFKGKTEFIG